jgi:hypothetical protein
VIFTKSSLRRCAISERLHTEIGGRPLVSTRSRCETDWSDHDQNRICFAVNP